MVPRLTMMMRRTGHGERRRGWWWESHAEHLPEADDGTSSRERNLLEPKTEITSTELTMVQDGAIEIQAERKILCAAMRIASALEFEFLKFGKSKPEE